MLSKYISEAEFTVSQTAARFGIKNQLDSLTRKNAIILCTQFLDKIREHYNKPLIITSGLRVPELNQKIGGARTSAHCYGYAADFHVVGVTNEKLFDDIEQMSEDMMIPVYDQLIFEGSWIHLGLRDGKPRHQTMIAIFTPGKPTSYMYKN